MIISEEDNFLYNDKIVDHFIVNGEEIWTRKNYLRFTALSNNSSIKIVQYGTPKYSKSILYSYNGSVWQDYTIGFKIILNTNESVYFRSLDTLPMCEGWNERKNFVMTGSFTCWGDLESLNNFETDFTYNGCFQGLFYNCTVLKNTPNLTATTLTDACYADLFNNCYSITSTVDILPVTTLTSACYWKMYYNTRITKAPELPALTLLGNSYYEMFRSCSKLTYIKAMFTDKSASGCLSNWVNGVASSGTFVKNADATWTDTGASGVPTNWTIETE